MRPDPTEAGAAPGERPTRPPASAGRGAAPLLGVICGLKSEAAALGPWATDPRVAVAITGARPGAALAAAERLAHQGVRGLVSFGMAGGLDPGLRPGDVVRPAAAANQLGVEIQVAAPAAGAPIARLLQAGEIIAEAQAKARLFREHGAGAVDMESFETALAAARRDLPTLILRVIADPAERPLPPAALRATRPDGGVSLWGVLGSVIRRPRQLPDLIRLSRDASAADKALRRLAATEIAPFLTTLIPQRCR